MRLFYMVFDVGIVWDYLLRCDGLKIRIGFILILLVFYIECVYVSIDFFGKVVDFWDDFWGMKFGDFVLVG